MTALERGHEADLFVTNVLNGTVAAKGKLVQQGTVVRVVLDLGSDQPPAVQSLTVVASGFSERTDPAALVLGPTGVALSAATCGEFDWQCDEHLWLYVADTLNNRISVISHPLSRRSTDGTGATFSSGGSLNGPLGLIVAEGSGHLLTVNGVDGYITEINEFGVQIAKTLLDDTGGPPPGNGALFGLVFDPAHGVYFVDDASNTLNLLH
jgi:DNA-binding beta-propeller fold protein YncE